MNNNNLYKTFYTNTIHGIPQLFVCKLWKCKIFWMIIIIIACTEFYFQLSDSIFTYVHQTVSESIDTTTHSVSFISFPAITICTLNYAFKENANILQTNLISYGITPEEIEKFYDKLPTLKYAMYFNETFPNSAPYENIFAVLSNLGYDSTDTLMQFLAHPCNKLIFFCQWDNMVVDCSSIFQISKTELGFCCSFNSNLFPVSSRKNYFTSAGAFHGLYVKFNISLNQYVPSILNYNLAVVYVHEKFSYAGDTSFMTYIAPRQEIDLKVSASLFEAEPKLRVVNLEARKCVFENEGYTYLQQPYRFSNCMMQCRSNIIYKLCNCIPFSYPKTDKQRNCYFSDNKCLTQHRRKYFRLVSRINKDDASNNTIKCECYPSCSKITYKAMLESLKIDKNDFGAVKVYFHNNWIKKYSLTRSMPGDVLLSTVGGVFALYLGGSFISIIIIFQIIKNVMLYTKCQKSDTQLYWNEINDGRIFLNAKFEN